MHTGWRWRYSVGARPLPLKVAPIQRSVTTDFHLQSRRDGDCQMSELQTWVFRHPWEFINFAYFIFILYAGENKLLLGFPHHFMLYISRSPVCIESHAPQGSIQYTTITNIWSFHQTSNISRTKSQNLNVSHLVLQLSLPNQLQLGVKSRMKM